MSRRSSHGTLDSWNDLESFPDASVINICPNEVTHRVVKLRLTATELQNPDEHKHRDPYFKAYSVENGVRELLYTSEVVRSCVNVVEWKPAVFGVPKGYSLKNFDVEIFDKEAMGEDFLLAGPVNVPLKEDSSQTQLFKSVCLNHFKVLRLTFLSRFQKLDYNIELFGQELPGQ